MSDDSAAPLRTNRRTFLKGAGATGLGLTLGFYWPERDTLAAQVGRSGSAAVVPNAFLRIAPDDMVTIIAKHVEHGVGIHTGLATLLAEELDADWSRVRVESAPANAALYQNLFLGAQATYGSNSMRNSYEQYRRVGAAARAMLIEAAARRWNVEPTQLTAEKGVIAHSQTSRKATFGELAQAAAALPVPANVPLKNPAHFTLVGASSLHRVDSVPKTNGTARFDIDVTLPGMLVAVVARPPRFGATVKSFDAAQARAITGVTDAVQIPTGIAVVANSFWTAVRARDALRITWDESKAERRSTAELRGEYKTLLDRPGAVARRDGDAEAALQRAAKVISATYEFPYLAHAPLQPTACVARLRPGGCEVWTGDAAITFIQNKAAKMLGLKPEQIEIHSVYAGGSFGRRGEAAVEAVEIAKAIRGRAAVKLHWTRAEDLQNVDSGYRPVFMHKATAGLDRDGNLIAWHHRIVGQSVLGQSEEFAARFLVRGVDLTSVAGVATTPYDIPNLRVEVHNTRVGVPVCPWRGNYHMTYAMESFMDEVAHASGRDPFELRRALLARDVRQKKIDELAVPDNFRPFVFAKFPRDLRVLELAAQKADWGARLAPGRARGIAVCHAYGTSLAQVAEITVRRDGTFKVDRVVCAVDCGVAVNPDVVRAQMEGGIAFGLGSVLHSEITLREGVIEQSNFHDYRVLRMDEMPHVDVHIMPSAEDPSGAGQPGVVPIGAAVANAYFAATGRRIRRLPVDRALASQD